MDGAKEDASALYILSTATGIVKGSDPAKTMNSMGQAW